VSPLRATMRLNQFDYFRAIAIIFIVAGHTIYESIRVSSLFDNLLVSIVTGGSALFVFISGFFFHHVFYKKFQYKNFMIKKVQNVLVPYILLTTITMMLYLVIFVNGYNKFDNTNLVYKQLFNVHTWWDVGQLYIWSLLVGKISAPYWYVPFIMIVFLLSPIFNSYIRLPENVRITIFVITLLIAMYVHRPMFNLSPLHAVVYYTPIYLLGINCSINRLQVTESLKGKAPLMLFIVVFLTLIQLVLSMNERGLDQIQTLPQGIFELIILQKIFICFFFLSILNKFEDKEIKTLKLISSSSFAIFFLHYGIFKVMYKLGVFSAFNFLNPIIVWFVTIVLVISVSIFIAYLVKLIFKEKSKYIVGW
jgi:fucose 4-O-acetylase-like acetyltransferase